MEHSKNKMMKKKCLLRLFALLICFSCVLSSAAVPLPRSLGINSLQDLQAFGVVHDHQVMARQALVVEELSRRMEIEVNDYPGSGANNRHDPPPKP